MMKKILPILLIAWILILAPAGVNAESPYTTWALGPGSELYMTQDAYSPADEIDLPISGAEDMVMTPDGFLYIADTANGRIVKLKNFVEVASYGDDILQGPTGLFVDEDGVINLEELKNALAKDGASDYILAGDGVSYDVMEARRKEEKRAKVTSFNPDDIFGKFL